ncbi:glycosyltransferase family 4 protein [Flavobacterium algicola]|uniref:glycosyltransferase family 4 protein n=1 Tax=Flavobacterium algicola TaxID=556529 RepID=UPI001EFE9F2B|nr:glycosyltransferase family 4 protein [Flavobacterium algicola]MCG9793518.1 glycosyltransferase family 4 protein [Flavobacterium algicola]
MAKLILFSHPTLNANSKNLISGLLREKMLFKLMTTIAIFPTSLLFKIGNYSRLKDLKRRRLNESWQVHTLSKSFYEFGRLLSSKLNIGSLNTHEVGMFCIDKVYEHHDNWVATSLEKFKKKSLGAVYCYEDGALKTFRAAKKIGLPCFYDLPIGYWKSARALMQVEYDKNPSWSQTLTGFQDSKNKLSKKDEELNLADLIFVASTFTKKTLEEYSGTLAEIKVIPYGFPEVTAGKIYEPLNNRKLKVLFVGGLSQRKGLSYLFDAVSQLTNQVSLTVVGNKAVENCIALNDALEIHNWIPSLPHDEVLSCMRDHDVFVFPSLFEGFGLVITEAMSQGVPVITTDRTAGPDIITHGKDGWIVDAASATSIKKILDEILRKPEQLEIIGAAARKKAATRPWSVYGKEMVAAISAAEPKTKIK